MNYACFDVDVQSSIAHIRLCRPDKRNSMIPSFWTELPTIVKQLDSNGDVRVIVLSSTGPHFSSGMDLSVFSNGLDSDVVAHQTSTQRAAQFYEIVQRLQHTFTCLEQVRVPVLVAIQGGCIGAGVDLVTAADMRYATRDAYFTIYETNLAMTADVGTFPRISHLMPDGLVRELAYTGRQMPAEEAQSAGLVNAVYDTHEHMLSAVLGIAKQIAAKAPMAIYGCKKMILHARDHSVAETLDYVALWNASFFQKEEIAEAMHATAEQRDGQFASLPAKTDDNADDDIRLP